MPKLTSALAPSSMSCAIARRVRSASPPAATARQPMRRAMRASAASPVTAAVGITGEWSLAAWSRSFRRSGAAPETNMPCAPPGHNVPRERGCAAGRDGPDKAREGEFDDASTLRQPAVSRGRSRDSTHTHFAELGYGMTDYWWTELEGHWESGADGVKFRTLDFENAFRLLGQESWWPETALFVEYDHAVDRFSPETATLGGLFRNSRRASRSSAMPEGW